MTKELVPCACWRVPRGPWDHLGHCCSGFVRDPDGTPRAKTCHVDVWERYCAETGSGGWRPTGLSRDEEQRILDAIITDLYGPPTPEQLTPAPRIEAPPRYVVLAPGWRDLPSSPDETPNLFLL